MGFGTLFFGYFLLLNITYYTFTDIIAALIMAMALYKLTGINRPFKNGFYISVVFSILGLAELILGIILMFAPQSGASAILEYIAILRYFIIAALTLFILSGINRVADEVKLTDLAKRARISMPFTLTVYTLCAVLEVPILEPILGIKFFIVATVIVLLAILILVTVNLVTIYRAYMKICMPEDKDNDVTEKPSRFEFINRHREHTRQREREYAEYKLEKMKKKASKKKK